VVEPGGRSPWHDVPATERIITVDRVRSALAAAPAPLPSPLENTGVRASAVLAALYERDGEVWVVLTRRAQHLRAHKGEVSFPGGGQDAGEPLLATALREAHEEIRLDPATVEIVGEIDHLQTVSSTSFIVPFVGLLPAPPSGLVASPGEVERIIEVPLSELLLDEVYHEEVWGYPGLRHPLIFFDIVGDTIWGATGSMLRNLLAVLTGTPWRR
jgi:8-oxo-dGTP pyrophosphatase MutT (NUDIX family)